VDLGLERGLIVTPRCPQRKPVRRGAVALTRVAFKADPAEARYGGAVDIERAGDLYAQGRTLRQIGDEPGVSSTTVSDQLRRAGVIMRRGAPAHSASTDQILELRDQGLTWNETAGQVDTVSLDPSVKYRQAASVASSPVGRPHRRQLLYGFITEGVNLHHVVAPPPGKLEPLVPGLIPRERGLPDP
jgi:hypothetical protein